MKRITLQFLRKWKPSFLASVGIGCVVFTATVLPLGPNISQGGFVDFTLDSIIFIISSVMYFFLIYIMGKFATLATNLVVMAAYFENFTTLPAIKEAWTVVRDLSNMIFIVILLLIAFGTLFRIEAYSWKKLLPKMILAAILINYSRAIIGALVDASQIVMLTFAEAIAAAADVGISRAFNLGSLLSFGDTDQGLTNSSAVKPDSKQRLLGIVAAGMMLATLVVVQLVYATVLVGRLVMIWFLTVLYPLAIACMVLPATEKYFKQANELLARYITVGPMCLFYLWLAMFIASKSTDLSTDITSHSLKNLKNVNSSSAVSGALEAPVVANFIIATMMLLAGMKMAQDNASEMGSITSKASSVGQWVAKAPATLGAKGAGLAAGYVNDRMYASTGMDLNLVRVAGRWKEGLDENRRKRELSGRTKAGEKYQKGSLLAGALGAGDQMAEKGISLDQVRGGVIGQVPLIGQWMNNKGFGINKEARYNRALNAEKKAKEDNSAAGKAATDEEAKLRGNHMTVPQFEREMLAAQTAETKAGGLVASAAAGGAVDVSKDADAKEALQDRLGQLQIDLAAAATPADASRISGEMAQIDAALKTTGPQTFNPTMQAQMTAAASALQTKRRARVSTLAANESTMTDSGRLRSQADLDAFINRQASLVPLQARLASTQKAEEAATEKRRDLRPQFSMTSEAKQRAMITESKKNITSNDSSQLQAMFLNALEDQRGADALAILERLAETNNYNDALGALRNSKKFNPPGPGGAPGKKYQYGISGVEDMSKLLQSRTGMTEQAVMSTIHYSGQQVKNFHATPLSELTEMVDQQIKFRSKELATAIGVGELRKQAGLNVGRQQGRLGWGDEAGDKGISPHEKAFLEAAGEDMFTRVDASQRTQMIDHAFKNLVSSPIRTKVYIDAAVSKHGLAKATNQINQLFESHGEALPNIPAIIAKDLKTMLAAAGKDTVNEYKDW